MAKVRCEKCGRKVTLSDYELDHLIQSKTRARGRLRFFFYLVAVLSGAAITWAVVRVLPQKTILPRVVSSQVTLGQIIETLTIDFEQYDLAVVNLACANGLPGAEDLNAEQCLKILDEWAKQVKTATAERRFVYDREPQKWDNSENWWRVAFLVSYLSRVIGTKYNPILKSMPAATHKYDASFFANSRDIFVHGLLTGNKQGTCSSMPVLVACIGRRLGYPLKLCRTPQHLFVRWDDPKTGERFNIEVTDQYAEKKTDAFYVTWPVRIAPEEVKRGGYLESLTPAQELATFLGFRGLCLWHAGKLPDAQLAFSLAHKFDPMNPGVPQYVITILKQEWAQGLNSGYNIKVKDQ